MRLWLCLIALILTPLRLIAQDVDLNLVLAMDCSFSVSAEEYRLQMQGTAAAFLDAEVVAAIRSGRIGRIAVSVVQWSNDDSQVVVVPWTVVGSARDASALAARISQAPRQADDGATSISRVIHFSIDLLRTAPFSAARSTIDIAGDGENNIGPDVRAARDIAVLGGITINGLAVINARGDLARYYRSNVIGGLAPFVEIANDYDAYGDAIKAKLLKEIRQPTS